MITCGACQQLKPRNSFYACNLRMCKACVRAKQKTYKLTDKTKLKRAKWAKLRRAKWARLNHQKIKLKVFMHYSNGDPKCACCGEKRLEFLCLDHINGGGMKHRKTFSGSIHFWIVKHGYPPGYRVMCHNCNMAIGFFGYCPHQEKSKYWDYEKALSL